MLAPRLALFLIIAGWAYLLWWTVRAGMGWWVSVAYVALLVCFAIVYARIRAEAGAPLGFFLN